MTTKPIQAWCVFDEEGAPKLQTCRADRARSINSKILEWDSLWTWEEIETMGYTCRRIEIAEIREISHDR